MQVRVRHEVIGGLPKIRFDHATMQKAGEVVVGSIRAGILEQRTIDGGKLKQNAPGTRRRKRKLGIPLLSLVAEGKRLVGQGVYAIKVIAAGPNKGLWVVPRYSRIARYVQEKGYRNWLGLHRRDIGAVRAVFIGAINAARRKAQSARTRSR